MRAKESHTFTLSRLSAKAFDTCLILRAISIPCMAWFSSMPMHAIAAEFESEIDAQAERNAVLSGGFQTDYIVQVLLSLILVIAVIVLLSYLVKKLNLQARAGSGAVRILSVVPIGAKDKLLLVEVGDEQLLLGSSPGNVQKLHLLEKPIDIHAKPESAPGERNFLSVLSSVRKGQQA